jgi:hypothetical protein
MLICTAAIVTSGLLVSAQDVKKDKRKNNVTIQDIQPVFPGLLKEKKPGVTVANLKFNAPIEQIGGTLPRCLRILCKKCGVATSTVK